MGINATWHTSHRMPSNPTPAQRLAWHDAHAQHCTCRPFTAAMRATLVEKVAAANARATRTTAAKRAARR